MPPNKLRRHTGTKHPNLENKPLDFAERKPEEMNTSKRQLSRFTKINEKAMHI
jgi:hypothetical protein